MNTAEREVEIALVNPLEIPSWDADIGQLRDATFFHTHGWARVLTNSYGYTPDYIVARRDGALLAALPLMEVDSWCTGRRGICLPFSDECGPVGEREWSPALFSKALAYGHSQRWRYCEIRDSHCAPLASPSISFCGHSLDLTVGTEQLWEGLERSVQRAIRKAERSNVEVEFSRSREALRGFYGLLCGTRHRHGVPPQPWRFFAQIQINVLDAGRGLVALARHNDDLVAGALFVQFGTSALFKFGGSAERFLELRPNNLLMWEAIQWHAQHGYERLDFGRTSLRNQGLRRFKQRWGTVEQMIHYVRHDFQRNAFVQSPDDSSGWQSMIFRRMPPSLSRLIGALAYRHAA